MEAVPERIKRSYSRLQKQAGRLQQRRAQDERFATSGTDPIWSIEQVLVTRSAAKQAAKDLPMSATAGKLVHDDSVKAVEAATSLLEDLQAAHSKVLTAMREMARTAAPPFKRTGELTRVRFQLSSASLARRMLVERACEFLRPRVGDGDGDALRSLARKEFEYFVRANAHVTRWSLERIARDWHGYCAASHEICGLLLDSVKAEQDVLYPLVARYRR